MAYPPAPQPLKVRYKTWYPVLFTVVGALLLVIGVLNLLVGEFQVAVILGPLLLLIGILTFVNPYASYEAGTVYLHSPLGFRAGTYGAAKGERLWFDGTNVLRILPDGKQKKVNLKVGRPEEVALVLQAIGAAQQQAQQ
ncbi:hypothetical protein ACFQS3_09165 [Glycomyces mayteni]|uniref:PH domain-containing protein n=1 Tax=Glycomyces mayteni TaxID=543887 RepID=A0ABW2D720_9ACTN|nr:hypothetical protein GCM10025732_27940 [Glycomyces mayteni]